jgi:hypothetical protein
MTSLATPMFPRNHTPGPPLRRPRYFIDSYVEGTHRQHPVDCEFMRPRESHRGVKLCELATEIPDLKWSGRLLRDYLDKKTAQFGT